jgi:hypothetical protein
MSTDVVFSAVRTLTSGFSFVVLHPIFLEAPPPPPLLATVFVALKRLQFIYSCFTACKENRGYISSSMKKSKYRECIVFQA